MRRAALASTFLAAAWLSLACLALPAPADAAIKWGVCAESNDVACGHLTVPLNPSDPSQGTITLALRRHRAPLGEAKDAVIALAGGPGQSAIPFLSQFAALLGPIVASRDLIAFDQRGTGFSHRLSCPALEIPSLASSPRAVTQCAGELGAMRGLYTTAQSVADIEDIREAGGYEKLVLYGTSYGTKVAERYAQEYPSHVEALVLDSVVPPNGPDAFERPTFAAVPRVLRQLCTGHGCAHITAQPVSDLARLVKRMGSGNVRGTLIDDDGRPRHEYISSNDLVEILLAGDFDPILRAEFPAAVHAAARGDDAALARLVGRAEAGEAEETGSAEAFDVPLYYATICDETAFPWNPTSSRGQRLREARGALAALGAGVFAPFTTSNALALSDIPACAGWPQTIPAGPEVDDAPLPDVPTLILSGADDLRTPTSGAREVAAAIPDSQLLVVPNTGHSVLGADPTPCAHNALKAFFEGRTVKQCKERTPPALDLPTPLPPRALGEVPVAPGNSGLPGRTLQATLLTFGDFSRQLVLSVLENFAELLLGSGSVRTGGLRAGWGGLVHGKVQLHGYSYVPGVTLTGKLTANGTGTLQIGGSAAARGTLHFGDRGTLSGVLSGQRVHLSSHTPPNEIGLDFAPASAARVNELVTHPKLLSQLRAHGIAALLRYAFGA